jgi:hypothetical protein
MQTSAPATKAATTDVIDAMRSIQTEDDLWTLADRLYAALPEGQTGFAAIIQEAADAGVDAGLSGNTLRAYRDTGRKWPVSRRIPNVSFSAHREAEKLIAKDGPVKPAHDHLQSLVKQNGAAKVTVSMVRQSVKAAQGKTPAGKAANVKKTAAKTVSVLDDLRKGAPELIAAMTTATADLDRIRKGLDKAALHVDRLVAKNAKQQTTSTTPVVAKKSVATKAAAPSTGRRPGDLRRPAAASKGK